MEPDIHIKGKNKDRHYINIAESLMYFLRINLLKHHNSTGRTVTIITQSKYNLHREDSNQHNEDQRYEPFLPAGKIIRSQSPIRDMTMTNETEII